MLKAEIKKSGDDMHKVVLFSINNVVVDLGTLDQKGLETLRFDLLDAIDLVNRALCHKVK